MCSALTLDVTLFSRANLRIRYRPRCRYVLLLFFVGIADVSLKCQPELRDIKVSHSAYIVRDVLSKNVENQSEFLISLFMSLYEEIYET